MTGLEIIRYTTLDETDGFDAIVILDQGYETLLRPPNSIRERFPHVREGRVVLVVDAAEFSDSPVQLSEDHATKCYVIEARIWRIDE